MSHPEEETKAEDLNATGKEEPLSEDKEIIEEIVEETATDEDEAAEQESN